MMISEWPKYKQNRALSNVAVLVSLTISTESHESFSLAFLQFRITLIPEFLSDIATSVFSSSMNSAKEAGWPPALSLSRKFMFRVLISQMILLEGKANILNILLPYRAPFVVEFSRLF